jgi:CubicO group peptidase (beta-lactamase class C family)
MRRAVVVLLLLIANIVFGSEKAGDSRASHRVAVPSTAAGRLLDEWLTAYNAGDREALRKFSDKRYTPEARKGQSPDAFAEAQAESRENSGGYDLVNLEEVSPTLLAAVLKSRGTWTRYVRLSLKVTAADQPLLVERTVGPAPIPAEEKKPAAELAKEIDRKLEELTQNDAFSGVAMIAKDGAPVWQKAYGMQNHEKEIPVNLETRFRLGSVPKMFTSVAIAQLVEAGKLRFTDKLADVWPDYPNREVAQKVSIHHLLTHTSGLGDIFGPAFFQKKDALRDLADYLPLFVDKPLQFEPASKWSYSNAGFIVLGLLIEKLSGQSYYDYLQQHIFAPAGMTNSGNTPKTEQPENLAIGYTRRWSALEPNTTSLPYRGMSAGGGEANAGDLVRFASALRSHKLVSREMTEQITTGKVEDQPGSGGKYAYGFGERIVDGRRFVGHNGGAPGMNAELSMLWSEGYDVVVLANLDPPVAQLAAMFIADRLL